MTDWVPMTAPRQVVPGKFYLVTRRCTQRQFLLRPDDETNRVFEFSLATAAARTNVQLIAWLAMSNHYHAVVYDPDGRVPELVHYHHKLCANVLNVKWGRAENLWAAEETSLTLLGTEADVLEKVVYVLANAIAAQLVESAAHWPGASSLRLLDGRARVIKRPPRYFKKAGSAVPDKVTLAVTQPPGSKARESFAAWADRVRQALAATEKRLATKRRESGARIVGRKTVLAARPTDTPSSAREPRKLRPRIACKDKHSRITLLLRLKEFAIHHRAARKELLEGVRNPVFPIGTYRARRMLPIVVGRRAPVEKEILRRHVTRLDPTASTE